MVQVYKNLGTVEIQDQISVTYPYMDPQRIDSVISCGISVAPVSSWLPYDSIYTERYMALPKENIGGYNNSVITGFDFKLHHSSLCFIMIKVFVEQFYINNKTVSVTFSPYISNVLQICLLCMCGSVCVGGGI